MSDMSVLLERLERLVENVHQYVGARYVPNFIDDPWNDTTRYEALDVVDNGSGTSYIAKKPVPPGTPLSNRNYWFVYGSTSGAIINLQNQIDTIVAGINSLESVISPKRVIVISDSYGQVPTSGDNMFTVFNALATSEEIIEDLYMYSSASGGFVHSGLNGTAYDMLHDNGANIPNHNSITDIVFAMGGNDITENNSDVANAYSTLKAYIDIEYPNAKVMCAFVTYDTNMSYTNLTSYIDKVSIMSNFCNVNDNWIFLDGMQYIMHNLLNVGADHVHPNQTGAKILGTNLYKCVMSRKGFKYHAETASNMETATHTAVSGKVIQIIDGELASIIVPQIDVTDTNYMLSNNYATIASIDNPLFVNLNGITHTSFIDPHNTNIIKGVGLKFFGNYLQATTLGTSTVSYPNGFTIPAMVVTIPTLYV